MDTKRAAYEQFFKKTEAGRELLEELHRARDECFIKAENNPDLARDYVQQARGIKLSIDHIHSVMIEIKKGGRTRKVTNQ